MTAQAALIADTIAGMKRVISRHHDSSDSDDPYLQPTNRGNKLKRKAYTPRDGDCGRRNGSRTYKRSIEHSNYHRKILLRNPKRFDEDGDELADSDIDDEADSRAAEENPYADIRLENLLMPLVSAASLPDHPSLSVPYTSPILTNMTHHACEMLQRERKTLATAKRLMTKLQGDPTWLPCELLCSEKDEAIFDTEKIYENLASNAPSERVNAYSTQSLVTARTKGHSRPGSRKSSTSGTELGLADDIVQMAPGGSIKSSGSGAEKAASNDGSPDDEVMHNGLEEAENLSTQAVPTVEMQEYEVPGDPGSETLVEDPKILERVDARDVSVIGIVRQGNNVRDDERTSYTGAGNPAKIESSQAIQVNMTDEINSEPDVAVENKVEDLPNPEKDENEGEIGQGIENSEDVLQPVPRRMRTRAQAQAASEPANSSRSESPEERIPPIHALFKIPLSAVPDKDFGLPTSEADETRRLLMAYVYQQEEVCRGAAKLYDGLLRADWQRKTILRWCKAEGHVGEMSDGEDWYDKEEWGLEEDLEKGLNDEEGENVASLGKKTRGRRA